MAVEAGPGLVGTPVLSCTVVSGADTCTSSATGTIDAGDVFYVHATNGLGGSNGNLIAVSYTASTG